jgi:ATP phosphoribosyltransferase
MSNLLKLGIPAGNLQEPTVELFRRAGYRITLSSRSYYPVIDDEQIECLLIRPQEIAKYVENDVLDVGVTGRDWVMDNCADVREVTELVLSDSICPARWVLCVSEHSPVQEVADLEGKCIATEAVGLTTIYLKKHGVEARVEFSWGATEVKPPNLADAIVQLVDTDKSLQSHNLRIVDEVLHSTTVLVASQRATADPWKKRKIDDIVMMLGGAMAAEGMVGLMMNVPRDALTEVLAILPALQQPTIANLADKDWVDVTTILNESVVREIIPRLNSAGACGIVEYPLNKVID